MNTADTGARTPKNWIDRWKSRGDKKNRGTSPERTFTELPERAEPTLPPAPENAPADDYERVFFVDYENVNREGLTGIAQLTDKDCVKIYYSRSAETLTFGLHRRILESAARFDYIKVQMPIKNAIDCLILFDVSDYTKAHPDASCFVVSHDTDFDRAIEEFVERGFKVKKLYSLSESNASAPKSPPKPQAQKNVTSQPAMPPKTQAPPKPAKPTPVKASKVSAVAVKAKREAQVRSFFGEHFKGEEYQNRKEEAIKVLLTSTTKQQVNNRLMKLYPNEVVSEMIKDLRPLIKDLPGK